MNISSHFHLCFILFFLRVRYYIYWHRLSSELILLLPFCSALFPQPFLLFFFFNLLNPYFPITLCTTYSLALFTVIIYETLGKFEQLYMTTTWLPRNYLRDELAEETSCKYADWRQMCTWVLLGCNLEMYRILREQMWSFLANFYFCVDWSIFLLLGMSLYLHLKTACLAMHCKFYLGS